MFATLQGTSKDYEAKSNLKYLTISIVKMSSFLSTKFHSQKVMPVILKRHAMVYKILLLILFQS